MSVLKKRRDMPVDEVGEDSFYANLLLGLPQTLGIIIFNKYFNLK